MNEKKDIWFAVVNPSAGSGKTIAKWHETETLLYDAGIKYKFVTPESASESASEIAEACKAGYRKFIAVGGDGTVHRLLCSLMEFVEGAKPDSDGNSPKASDFTLVSLPIGSGNDWLKSHNLPHDHTRLIELISAGYFMPQDIVKAELFNEESGKVAITSYMANIGGYAFDAAVCDVVNFQKAHGVTGKLIYINALKKKAFAQKPVLTKIIIDGEQVYDGPIYTMSFGNGRYSGGGLRQTPSALMNDGLFNIMAAPKFSVIKVLTNLKKVLNGEIENVRFLNFYTAKTAEILPHGQGQLVEIDGDVIGRSPLRLTVMEDRINVLHLDN